LFLKQIGNYYCLWLFRQETVVADLSEAAMTKSVVEGADLHCLLARVLSEINR
jgi:hypothetical protein